MVKKAVDIEAKTDLQLVYNSFQQSICTAYTTVIAQGSNLGFFNKRNLIKDTKFKSQKTKLLSSLRFNNAEIFEKNC